MGKVLNKIVKTALDKGKNLDKKYSWTIYFLFDLKVMYIILPAFITAVNVILSTANSEATSDANGISLFNVTSSPGYTNVEVDSISDAILWNCRRQSLTNKRYKIIYCVLFAAMSAALLYFFVPKFMTLITVNCNRGSFNKNELTKLWHIAILEQLKDLTKPLKLSLKEYQPLIDKGIPEDLKLISSCKNCCRRAIPEILLCLCVVILGLFYLSYDLHPLACVSQPEEAHITYNSTTKRVKLEISDELLIFQKVTGFFVFSLVLLHLFLAHRFYRLSKAVISDLKPIARKRIESFEKAKGCIESNGAMNLDETTPVNIETTF